MIGRMRPFYQTHWDISKDIKHVWLLFCTYYIAWILGDEGRGKMVATPVPSCGPSAPGVDPPVCCILAVTYVRGSFCWLLAPGFQFLSGEGRHHGTHGTGLTRWILSPACAYVNQCRVWPVYSQRLMFHVFSVRWDEINILFMWLICSTSECVSYLLPLLPSTNGPDNFIRVHLITSDLKLHVEVINQCSITSLAEDELLNEFPICAEVVACFTLRRPGQQGWWIKGLNVETINWI